MRWPFLFVAMLLLPVSAHSSRGWPAAGQREYAGDVYDYATCTVRNYHNRSRDLILADIDNAAMERKFGDLYTSKPLAFVSGCRELFLRDRQGIAIDPDLFRYALAAVLVKRDFANDPSAGFSNVAPLSHRAPESEAQYQAKLGATGSEKRRAQIKFEHDKDLTQAWLAQFGECVARKNPVSAKDWIVSSPESAAENAAIKQMSPEFSACLAEGEALTFPKTILRGTVAINYYRLAMAMPVHSTGAAPNA